MVQELWLPPVAGNAGLVTMTGVGTANLMHTLALGRSAKITKIMAYAPGAAGTLQVGTRDRTAVPAFVALMPLFSVIGGLDNEWTHDQIPAWEFVSNSTAGALGRSGDIWILSTVAGITVLIEVAEKAG